VVPQVFYRRGRADFSVAENGTLIYRPSNRKDRQLAWYDRTGRLIEKIGDPNDYHALRLSPDDQRIAFVDEEPDWTSVVWLMDLATKRVSRVANPGHECFFPVWSPDGKELIYASGNVQGMKLLRQSVTRTAPVTILDTPGPKFPSDWSADGRFLMYFTPWPDFVRLKTALFEVKTASYRTVIESRYNETEAVFSPESTRQRWIAYTSTETGRSEVYVRSFPDLNQRLQISNGGGWQPLWRKDGRELFYLSPDGIIMAVGVTASNDFRADPPRPLFRTSIPPYPGRPELPAKSYAVTQAGQLFLVNEVIDEASRNTISVITHSQANRR
jgi:dipeptidyl aminopeptidase/acylaminoacyl peptidase